MIVETETKINEFLTGKISNKCNFIPLAKVFQEIDEKILIHNIEAWKEWFRFYLRKETNSEYRDISLSNFTGAFDLSYNIANAYVMDRTNFKLSFLGIRNKLSEFTSPLKFELWTNNGMYKLNENHYFENLHIDKNLILSSEKYDNKKKIELLQLTDIYYSALREFFRCNDFKEREEE